MAQYSLSNLLVKRKRIRIVSIFSLLLLAGALGSFIISKNPWGAKADSIISTGSACQISGSVNLLAGDTTCDGKDLVIDGSLWSNPILTIYGHHDFNSVTISNGGKLTHAELTGTETTNCDSNNNGSIFDSTDPQTAECTNARNKKVDITVSNDITLSDGGQINVDGKGYSGAIYTGTAGDCEGYHSELLSARSIDRGSYIDYYGWGPGGGISYRNNSFPNSWVDLMYAGGGGFGGKGGMGIIGINGVGAQDATTGSQSYPYLTNNNLEFGSGGGGAVAFTGGHDNTCVSGGNGGGRIIINANRIIFNSSLNSKITANGTNGSVFRADGVNTQDDGTNTHSGGGAGGNIYIRAQSILYHITGVQVVDLQKGTDRTSEDGVKDISEFDSDLYQMEAKGGDGYKPVPNGGGGGRIVVKKIAPTPAISIKKTLYPYTRTGAPAIGDPGCSISNPLDNPDQHNCFNPYAMQLGDIIKVVFYLTGGLTTDSYLLSDDYLSVPSPVNHYKCSTDGLHNDVGTSTCPNGAGGNTYCLLNDGSGLALYSNFANLNIIGVVSSNISWSLNGGDHVNKVVGGVTYYDAIYYYCKVQ